MKDEELKRLLIDLQSIFDSTTIFEIPPHFERWEDGLKSLDKVRVAIAKVKAHLEQSAPSPPALVSDVARIHGMLGDFVKLRDDFYSQYPNGGDSPNWRSLASAGRQLEELQRKVADLKSRIRGGEFAIAVDSSKETPAHHALRTRYLYSTLGLGLGALAIVGGVVLGVSGVTGSTAWTAHVLGLESNINDATPGVMLFIVGVFMVWITKPEKIQLSKWSGND